MLSLITAAPPGARAAGAALSSLSLTVAPASLAVV